MQGIKQQIPTELKAEYLNLLLKAGFGTIDFGSFVSPAAIPQMKDTASVLDLLDLSGSNSRLLAIVANERGAAEACIFSQISILGFPFSISETFQRRNTNSGIEESLKRVEEIQKLCVSSGKELLVYVSMAFGNPYHDPWHPDLAVTWCQKLAGLGIKHLALADTVGSSTPETITSLFTTLLPELQGITLGAHLHSTPERSMEKIVAAYDSGCRNFDVAVHGFGGCPMAKDDLTGNIATETLMAFISDRKLKSGLDEAALQNAFEFSWKIFSNYH
jgi:hydroxymethylglutaryl-CoA lyase